MKKRFLNLFLALVMVAFVVPTWADAATKCWHDSKSKYCTVEKVEAKAATCTEDGNEEYYYCTFCKKNMKLGSDGVYTERVATDEDIVIPAAHKYVSRVCTECGHCEDNHIHNKIIVEAKSATCAEDGAFNTVYQCKDCKIYFCKNASGKYDYNTTGEFPDNVIPATGEHTYSKRGTTTKQATCNEEGVKEYKCTNTACNAVKTETIKKLNHRFPAAGTVIEAATCLEDGLEEFTCKRGNGCTETKTEVIPATGHSFTKWEYSSAATCVKDGCKAGYVCEDCGEPKDADHVIPATGEHQYTVEVESLAEATCTEPEHVLFKCEDCDDTTESTKGTKLYHRWDAGVVTQQATCTEDGVKTFTCGRCGDTKTETIEAEGHKWQGFSEVAATCDKEGRTAGTWCWVCEYVREGLEPIEKLPHTPGGMKRYITRPTCQETGEAEYYCQNCEGTVTKVVRKLNCVFETVDAVAPTCNNTGWTEYQKCTSCGENQSCAYCAELSKGEVVPALGHNQVLNENHTSYKKPTCIEAGVDVFDCTRCGYDGVEVVVPALQHQRVETVMRAVTCTEPGRLYVECERDGCGFYWVEAIAPTGHTEEIMPAVDATCTATGLTEGKKCSVCNETLVAQVVTDKLAHAWKNIAAKDPTCEVDGYNAHRECEKCGETDGKNVIPAGAAYHDYENFKCNHCGQYDPNHQHDGTETVITPATCTAAGVKKLECATCDYVNANLPIEKLPHSYGDNDRCTCGALNPAHQHTYAQTDYREPTCDIGGQVTKQCSVCGDTTQTTINALGHSYSNGKCIRCGTAAACTHTNTTTRVQKEATCGTTGLKVTTCDNCGVQTDTEVIAATGIHNHVNGVCSCGHRDESKVTSTLDNHGVYIVG